MSAGGNEAGFNVPLPVSLQEVIRAYKAAIKELSADIRRLDQQAEESRKIFGAVDQALVNRSAALVNARQELMGNLQAKKDEFAAGKALDLEKARENEAVEAATDRLHARVQIQSTLMRKLGFSGGIASEASNYLHMASHTLSTGGAQLVRAGFVPLGQVSQAAGAGVLRGALAIGKYATGPAGIAIAAATYGLHSWGSAIESRKEAAELAQKQVDAYFDIIGRPSQMGAIESGSTELALRVFQGQQKAKEEGMRLGMVGAWDYIVNPLGVMRGDQAKTIEAKQEYDRKLQVAKLKFGVDYDPVNNPMTHRAAKESYDKRTNYFRDPSGAFWYDLRSAYYQGSAALVPGLLGRPGDAILAAGQARKTFDESEYDLEARKAGERDMQSRAVAWGDEERKFKESAAFALNRVLQNENRRWLRDVETDRVARFNAWSMQ